MCTLWISQIHLLLMFMYVYICYVETLIIIFFYPENGYLLLKMHIALETQTNFIRCISKLVCVLLFPHQ